MVAVVACTSWSQLEKSNIGKIKSNTSSAILKPGHLGTLREQYHGVGLDVGVNCSESLKPGKSVDDRWARITSPIFHSYLDCALVIDLDAIFQWARGN